MYAKCLRKVDRYFEHSTVGGAEPLFFRTLKPEYRPKEATSTPISLSLVDMSAPVNGLSSPVAIWLATASAISYPGATRP